MKRSGERVSAIGERRDDGAASVAEVLVAILELAIDHARDHTGVLNEREVNPK